MRADQQAVSSSPETSSRRSDDNCHAALRAICSARARVRPCRARRGSWGPTSRPRTRGRWPRRTAPRRATPCLRDAREPLCSLPPRPRPPVRVQHDRAAHHTGLSLPLCANSRRKTVQGRVPVCSLLQIGPHADHSAPRSVASSQGHGTARTNAHNYVAARSRGVSCRHHVAGPYEVEARCGDAAMGMSSRAPCKTASAAGSRHPWRGPSAVHQDGSRHPVELARSRNSATDRHKKCHDPLGAELFTDTTR